MEIDVNRFAQYELERYGGVLTLVAPLIACANMTTVSSFTLCTAMGNVVQPFILELLVHEMREPDELWHVLLDVTPKLLAVDALVAHVQTLAVATFHRMQPNEAFNTLLLSHDLLRREIGSRILLRAATLDNVPTAYGVNTWSETVPLMHLEEMSMFRACLTHGALTAAQLEAMVQSLRITTSDWAAREVRSVVPAVVGHRLATPSILAQLTLDVWDDMSDGLWPALLVYWDKTHTNGKLWIQIVARLLPQAAALPESWLPEFEVRTAHWSISERQMVGALVASASVPAIAARGTALQA